MRGPSAAASASTWRTPSTVHWIGLSIESTSRWPWARKLMIEYIVVIAPLKAGEVIRMSPRPERISSTSRTRSSSSRPSVLKSFRNVERLMSLIDAPTPVVPGTVWATTS